MKTDLKNKLFSGPWVAVAIVVGLLILKIFTAIPFWWMLGIVIFFTLVQIIFTGGEITPGSKVLGVAMAIVFVCAVADSAWEANFRRSYNKKEVAKARLDQTAAALFGDQTRVDAEDIWEFQKTKHGQKFLSYYNRLLNRGRVQEAADTLIGFLKAWDLEKRLKEQPENSDQAENHSEVDSVAVPSPQTSSESITLHGEEKWFPNHSFRRGEKIVYIVKYNSVRHLASDGPRIIEPGRYEGIMPGNGSPTFECLGKLTEVTIIYGRI